MILRILGEGQYDVSGDAMDRLNELDAAVEAAVEAGDTEQFSKALAAYAPSACRTTPRPSTSPT